MNAVNVINLATGNEQMFMCANRYDALVYAAQQFTTETKEVLRNKIVVGKEIVSLGVFVMNLK